MLALNGSIRRREESSKVNYPNSHIRELDKEEQITPKVSKKEGNNKCTIHYSDRKQIDPSAILQRAMGTQEGEWWMYVGSQWWLHGDYT